MLGTDGSHDIGSATIKVGLMQESHVGVHLNNNVNDSAKKVKGAAPLGFFVHGQLYYTTLHYS
jgi:hypothetical protein